MKTFFAGELNPVGPKASDKHGDWRFYFQNLVSCPQTDSMIFSVQAQKKVPVPEGLDLDAWINEPEEESEEDDEEEAEIVNGNVFVKEDPDSVRRKVVEPSEEELEATRVARQK